MSASPDKPVNGVTVGLCETCTHAKRIVSDRGSLFWQCGLAADDPRFPKYPRLPVLQCAGFEQLAKTPK
ncbi:MAG TPA: hypothetical protein VJS43_02085 [Candidatus Acidoferrales bacterium]|nr:hypothetical protein [Candidatus Acidoferrales bacterium]